VYIHCVSKMTGLDACPQ